MKKRICAMILCMVLLCHASAVYAGVLNFEATVNIYKQDNKQPQYFEIDDGSGNTVRAIAKEDIVYVTARDTVIRSVPGESGQELRKVLLGTKLQRVAVCDNGWSKVTFQKQGEARIIGYVSNQILSDRTQMKKFTETVAVKKDADILDFPGRKDGEVVGEILELDEVLRTGSVNDVWSRILYQDTNGVNQVGYVPTEALDVKDSDTSKKTAKAEKTDKQDDAGTIHKSDGTGIFADAVDGVTAAAGTADGTVGVQVGNPIAVSSDAVLKPMGTFRITHYCPCSICCGPWANGITSTGVTAVTNRTIAVDPTQIPYGSKVVINGQVYVAEDCGGAIKTNCIDIYVATHEEGESKGVYYTDVYLIQE